LVVSLETRREAWGEGTKRPSTAPKKKGTQRQTVELIWEEKI
jgi:hypothetical protein